MYGVELYAAVRLAVVDEGLSHHEVGRRFGIDAILETDRVEPREQRHTVQKIFERLRDAHGFTGSYTIVKDNACSRRQSAHEAFVPRHHPPGQEPHRFQALGCALARQLLVLAQTGRQLRSPQVILEQGAGRLSHSEAPFVRAWRQMSMLSDRADIAGESLFCLRRDRSELPGE